MVTTTMTAVDKVADFERACRPLSIDSRYISMIRLNRPLLEP